ncbi:MAG: ATP-binding protein, partial [Eubacteriales bacterium]|nr:ATP-binding protein [Eubacteriales bacterium]
MRDLSLHLMDLAQNSIQSGARQVGISLKLDGEGRLALTIRDDGCGMSPEILRQARSPFGTSRATRKVGMGIPLAENNAAATGGCLDIKSAPGQGTELTAAYYTGHIDCPPLGNLGETMAALILANPEGPEFNITLQSPRGRETLDTREIRQALKDVPLNSPEVIAWIYCFKHAGLTAFVTDTKDRAELFIEFCNGYGGQAEVDHVVQVW